jgi:shikimate dehydrogenase
MKFISIAKYPGIMGKVIFNFAFKKLKIKATYIPIKKNKLGNLRKYLKKEKILGSGVSMPFKEKVIKYLDKTHSSVLKTNSCNTITFRDDEIKGYNTDTLGIKKLIKLKKFPKNLEFYIYGAGGYSRSFYEALRNLKYKKIFVINKSKKRLNAWPKKNKINTINQFPNKPSNNIIVNATPVGMKEIEKKEFLSNLNLNKTKYYIECVVSPKQTQNTKIAKKNNIKVIYGYEISIEQALIQLKIYTNKVISKKIIKKKLNQIIN